MEHKIFNYIEGLFWIAFALIVFIGSGKSGPKRRKLACIASVGLCLFGVSDIIEARTGAWWQPGWLLFLKVFCITAVVVSLVFYFKRKP